MACHSIPNANHPSASLNVPFALTQLISFVFRYPKLSCIRASELAVPWAPNALLPALHGWLFFILQISVHPITSPNHSLTLFISFRALIKPCDFIFISWNPGHSMMTWTFSHLPLLSCCSRHHKLRNEWWIECSRLSIADLATGTNHENLYCHI